MNQLSSKSGAVISISESTSKDYGRIWKYIQLKGPGRAVDKAKKLLHIRLERLETKAGTDDKAKVDEEIVAADDE